VSEEKGEKCFTSLNLDTDAVRNGLEADLIEPAMPKVKSTQLATQAAITILKIDDLIKVKPDPKLWGGGATANVLQNLFSLLFELESLIH
jgi:T-complex protein 1 subunit alpha